MPPLKLAFEDDNSIALVKDENHLSDLRLVKIIRGIPTVPPVRTGETGKKRHGDFAIALALAYFASRMQWYAYGYEAQRPIVPDTRREKLIRREERTIDPNLRGTL